jgi:osmotically-inducible protein OsmY
MQTKQVRRVLVKHQDELVGIVSRSDIVHLLASRPAGSTEPQEGDDDVIRFKVLETLMDIPGTSPWNTTVEVKRGIVQLIGSVEQENSLADSVVQIKNIPHVMSVRDERTILQPY